MSCFCYHYAFWQAKHKALLPEAEWPIKRKYYYYLDLILL